MDLSDQRISYETDGIDLAALHADPVEQFTRWFADAQAGDDPEPYAMVLSTVDADGWPLGRTVLLRHVDVRGFVFYTNYGSAKAQALEATGRAGLTFHWAGQHRQVHVSGAVERVSAEESDAYFAKRPRDSQLGAWASEQSTQIAGRHVLEGRLADAEARFAGTNVTRPDFWGGYRVSPRWIEFWQGQPNRLHDRVRYVRASGAGDETGADGWGRVILSP